MASPSLLLRPSSSQADPFPPSSSASTSSFQTAQDSLSHSSSTGQWSAPGDGPARADGSGGGGGRATPTSRRPASATSDWEEHHDRTDDDAHTDQSASSPQVNPFHLLSQSQAQYAAVLPPAKGLLARSPPSHPPPTEVHIHKVSPKSGIVILPGPGPTSNPVELGVRRIGAAVKGAFGGSGSAGDGSALEVASSSAAMDGAGGPSRMGGPPPSPPPSDGETTPVEEEQSSRASSSSRRPASRATVDTSLSSPPSSDPSSPPVNLPPSVPPKDRSRTSFDIPMRDSPVNGSTDGLATSPAESDALPPLPSHDQLSLRKSSMSSSVGGGRGRMASESDTERMGFAAPSSPGAVDSSLPSRTVPSSPSSYFDALYTPTVASSSSSKVPAPINSAAANSAASSSHLHPSSASNAAYLSVTPPSPTRRNTTGSTTSTITPGSPQSAAVPLPRHLHKTHSHHQPRASSTPAAGLQTSVPGVDGAALDPDILAQAETIRKERLSRRARKAQADSDSLHDGTEAEGPEMARVNLDRAAPGPSGVTRGKSTAQHKDASAAQIEEARVLVGNLIGEDHVNYVLMYNMLTGIRIGVSRCQAKISRPLTPEDFVARHKFSFDIVGNELTPSARYDFKFKDYAPWVFRDLRDNHFHLDAADYLLSLTAKYILSELGSPGKSGSFFYFSRDYRFIIKTISHTEHKFLRSILKEYHAHVVNNPHTLLSRFYGLHRVKLPRGRKIHFVIMNNLFPPHRDIHETYDLKGSSVGREYPEEKAKNKKGAVLKDINWVRRDRNLNLGPEKAALLSEQLRRDAEFLKTSHIMDYSLLIGIHEMERGNRDGLNAQKLQLFDPNVGGVKRRKPSSVKHSHEAQALRKAVQRSDPRPVGQPGTTHHLSESDTADRKHFLFYQDEGGLRATDECNEPLDVIYYLGVIDICTPYSFVKKVEHMWKSFTEDRHGISAVPPNEYGDRFINFLTSCLPKSDPNLRPVGLRPTDVKPLPDVPTSSAEAGPSGGRMQNGDAEPQQSTDQADTNEHILPKTEKPKYKAE